MKNVCFYHAHCTDGFAAAWAVWKYFTSRKEEVILRPISYSEEFTAKDVANVMSASVYFVDFCPKYKQLIHIAALAHDVTVLDHHISAERTIDELFKMQRDVDSFKYDLGEDEYKVLANMTRSKGDTGIQTVNCRKLISPNLHFIFDQNRSGAGLAYDYFHKYRSAGVSGGNLNPRPAFINLIEDRDLWQFKLKGSKQLHAALGLHGLSLMLFSELSQNDDLVESYIKQGELLVRQNKVYCKKAIQATVRQVQLMPGEPKIPAVNAPHFLASDIGEMMYSETHPHAPYVAVYFIDSSKRLCVSLRSAEVHGTDVSKVAKKFGGGGHKHAAGFNLESTVL